MLLRQLVPQNAILTINLCPEASLPRQPRAEEAEDDSTFQIKLGHGGVVYTLPAPACPPSQAQINIDAKHKVQLCD